MESLNQTLFLWLNAPEHPSALALTLATFFAEQLIWAVPLLIGIGWLRGSEAPRKAMLVATASGLLGLLINQAIGLAWFHPRPFMIGLGHTLIPHVANSSFPSDHLTLWWAVVFSLALQRGPRIAGIGLVLLGVPIAWARIYLGGSFPVRHARGCHGRCTLFMADVARSALVSGAELPACLRHPSPNLWKVDRPGMGARVSLWPG
jgi:undecaprenyl-diphosphatase